MKSLLEYSDGEIALILVGGGVLAALIMCLGLCGLLHGFSRSPRRRISSSSSVRGGSVRGSGHRNSGGRSSLNGIRLIKEQSQSVVRGEHPITFVLPTVSMSEPCSEYSDLESLTAAGGGGGDAGGAHTSTGTFSSSAASPSISLATSPRSPSSAGASPRLLLPGRMTRSGGVSLHPGGLERGAKRRQHHNGHHHRRRIIAKRPVATYSSDSGPRSEHDRVVPFRRSAVTAPLRGFVNETADVWEESEITAPMVRKEETDKKPPCDTEADLGTMRIAFRTAQGGKAVEITEILLRQIDRERWSSVRENAGGDSGWREEARIRIKMYPGVGVAQETGTTCVVSEEASMLFTERIALTDVENKRISRNQVIKLSLLAFSEDASTESAAEKTNNYRRNCYGHCLVNLRHLLPLEADGSSRHVEERVVKSVTSEMVKLFSDSVEISLGYEPIPGKLVLGVIQAKLAHRSTSHGDFEKAALLYAKVTLYDGHRVIKAKKTRPLGFSERVFFHETFSILFPVKFLERVSCVVSLCVRRGGLDDTKRVLGRLCLGPEDFAVGSGLEHWKRMAANPEGTVIQWHSLT